MGQGSEGKAHHDDVRVCGDAHETWGDRQQRTAVLALAHAKLTRSGTHPAERGCVWVQGARDESGPVFHGPWGCCEGAHSSYQPREEFGSQKGTRCSAAAQLRLQGIPILSTYTYASVMTGVNPAAPYSVGFVFQGSRHAHGVALMDNGTNAPLTGHLPQASRRVITPSCFYFWAK